MEHNGVPKYFCLFCCKSLKFKPPQSPLKASSSSSSLNSSTNPKSRSSRALRRSSASSREDEFLEVFRRFDGDNDGKISAKELRSYFGSIGEYMSHEEAVLVINDLDSDGDGMIDFQDFLKLMKKDQSDHDEEGDLKAAFEMFEFGKGSGRITAESLQRVLNRLGDTNSYDECAAMIQVYDMDGKGELNYHEFQQMMMG